MINSTSLSLVLRLILHNRDPQMSPLTIQSSIRTHRSLLIQEVAGFKLTLASALGHNVTPQDFRAQSKTLCSKSNISFRKDS